MTADDQKLLIDYLEEKISTGQYPATMKIPSLRKLSDNFNISSGSARKAIDTLHNNGLVEKRHGSGVYVKRKAIRKKKSKTKIAVLTDFGWLSAIYSTVFLGIQKAASSKEINLLLNFNSKKSSLEQLNQTINESDGTILLGADDGSEAHKSFSLKNPIAAVCNHNSNSGKISIIDIDPFLAAEHAVRYFKEKKIKTVIVVSSQGYLNRGKIFSLYWQDSGGNIEHIKYDNKISFKQSNGYFFTTGTILQYYSELFLAETGKILSDSNVILGIDGKNRLDPAFHKTSSIAIEWQLAGEHALNEVLFRINNPGSLPKRIYLPGELYAV